MTIDFTIKRGDLRPSVQASLTDAVGDAIVLPAGSTARFNMRQRYGGTKVVTGAAVVASLGAAGPPATAAVLRYDFVVGDTSVVGTYDAEFEVALAGSATNLETFPNDRDLLVAIRRDVA